MNLMINDLEQLRGEVERLVYSSKESGSTICRLVVPGRDDLVTIAGNMPGIQPGERLLLRGRWINHPVHGYLSAKLGSPLEPARMGEPFPMHLLGCEKSGAESKLKYQDIRGEVWLWRLQ